MSDDSPKWTRRSFLNAVGRAGGAAAVYETMVALGMVRVPTAFAGPPQLESDHGRGQRVVIHLRGAPRQLAQPPAGARGGPLLDFLLGHDHIPTRDTCICR